MGTYGGTSPQPERYGGGKRRVEHVLDALLQSDQQEVGLDVAQGDNVWIEEVATARAIDAAWSTNARGANEFDPRRTQSMLPRWEDIFGLVPLSGETLPQRRADVTFRFQALNKSPTYGQVTDDLTFLGTSPDGASNIFVGLMSVPSSEGPSYYPGSPFPNPYDLTGNTTAGVSLVDWWTAILNVPVLVTRPSTMSAKVFNDLVGKIGAYLDGTLPAWCTFSIYQDTHAGSPGFFLDEGNLGVEALRT